MKYNVFREIHRNIAVVFYIGIHYIVIAFNILRHQLQILCNNLKLCLALLMIDVFREIENSSVSTIDMSTLQYYFNKY